MLLSVFIFWFLKSVLPVCTRTTYEEKTALQPHDYATHAIILGSVKSFCLKQQYI